MTERRPLVVIDGIATVLPPEDSLPGGGATSDINNVTYQWDFLNQNTNADLWSGGAVSGGTNNATATAVINNKHPGVVLLRSVNTANSGYRYTSQTSTSGVFVLDTGVKFSAVINCPGATDAISNVGMTSVTTASTPMHGAFFTVAGLNVTATCISSGSSSSLPLPAITADTWYTFEVDITSATSVTFRIYTEAGDLHGSVTLSTSVPTVALGCGVIAFCTAATQTNLIYVDLLRLQFSNIGRG